MDFEKVTKAFLLNEFTKPTIEAYIQAAQNSLDQVTPRSQKERRALSVAQENLSKIAREVRKLKRQLASSADAEETTFEV